MLDIASDTRGIEQIPRDAEEFDVTMKTARRRLAVKNESAMLCKLIPTEKHLNSEQHGSRMRREDVVRTEGKAFRSRDVDHSSYPELTLREHKGVRT